MPHLYSSLPQPQLPLLSQAFAPRILQGYSSCVVTHPLDFQPIFGVTQPRILKSLEVCYTEVTQPLLQGHNSTLRLQNFTLGVEGSSPYSRVAHPLLQGYHIPHDRYSEVTHPLLRGHSSPPWWDCSDVTPGLLTPPHRTGDTPRPAGQRTGYSWVTPTLP